MLVAGPWAVKGRIVNPSYVSPCTYAELGAHTGDGRWERLRDSGLGMARAWAAEGRLPPDWAKVVEGARLEPIGSPGRPERGPRNGLDAARLPFRLSEGCDEEATELAGQFWDRLRVLEGGGAALAYGLDERRLEPAEHPLGLVAAGVAAVAAGRHDDAQSLLDGAADLQRRHPTYYGAALLALGQVLIGGGEGGVGRATAGQHPAASPRRRARPTRPRSPATRCPPRGRPCRCRPMAATGHPAEADLSEQYSSSEPRSREAMWCRRVRS